MRIEINELEILPPDATAGTGAEQAGADPGNPEKPPRPPADLGEQLRHWHREARVRECRLMAD